MLITKTPAVYQLTECKVSTVFYVTCCTASGQHTFRCFLWFCQGSLWLFCNVTSLVLLSSKRNFWLLQTATLPAVPAWYQAACNALIGGTLTPLPPTCVLFLHTVFSESAALSQKVHNERDNIWKPFIALHTGREKVHLHTLCTNHSKLLPMQFSFHLRQQTHSYGAKPYSELTT